MASGPGRTEHPFFPEVILRGLLCVCAQPSVDEEHW